MRRLIRLGDPTSHGGKVVQVSVTQFQVDGIPVARKGDVCVCPIQGHQSCFIAEGDESFLIEGVPAALEGHKTSCGATLISTAGEVGKS